MSSVGPSDWSQNERTFSNRFSFFFVFLLRESTRTALVCLLARLNFPERIELVWVLLALVATRCSQCSDLLGDCIDVAAEQLLCRSSQQTIRIAIGSQAVL